MLTYVFHKFVHSSARFLLIFTLLLMMTSLSMAESTCSFTFFETTMTLNGSCTTDSTIYIPDGYTLNGAGYSITAVDPLDGHFLGAVVQNGGSVAHVTNLTVTAQALKNTCDDGAARLRGIMFEGASGSIVGNTVTGINQGASGCQEGNAIEIRNAPFDGTHPNTQYVEVLNNTITTYQKTGVVANGDVSVTINGNWIGSAGLDDSLAANSVQFGFGGYGTLNNNSIGGNDWDGISADAATAVLIYLAGDVNVNHNMIYGEGTDVGIYALYSGTINVKNNEIHRTPDDNLKDLYGVGVWFDSNAGKSKVVHNTFSGWIYDYEGADLAKANILPAD